MQIVREDVFKDSFIESQVQQCLTDAFFEKVACFTSQTNAKRLFRSSLHTGLYSLLPRLVCYDTDGSVKGVLVLRLAKQKLNLLKFTYTILLALITCNVLKVLEALRFSHHLSCFEERKCSHKFGMVPEVLFVATHKNSRGKGVGTQLLSECHDWLRSQGFHSVGLIVYESNPAVHLYERFGYKVTDRISCSKFPNVRGTKYETFLWMEADL
ncbi:hypothetical protein RCL1_002025 [Eukaryota sp. TZLM3-RCL]